MGYSAAQKFGVTPVLGILMGAILSLVAAAVITYLWGFDKDSEAFDVA